MQFIKKKINTTILNALEFGSQVLFLPLFGELT